MKKIELEIVTLSHSVTQSHNYAVVLQERKGKRRLPIVIGGFEAQAIAVAIEKMRPNRPLTHDLFKSTLDAFNIQLQEIIINNLLDGIFYAKLICEREGQIIEMDSRTSDAIALAVRYNAPIFAYDFILEDAGVVMDEMIEADEDIVGVGDSDKKESNKPKKKRSAWSFEDYNLKELNKMLNDVLETENYEKAAKIRDEINKRQEGKP